MTFSVDVTDEQRRAINEYCVRPGLATREQVREFYLGHGLSADTYIDDVIEAWKERDVE